MTTSPVKMKFPIEPTSHFQEAYPLQMAFTLVDINDGCTCEVRILNPFPTAMSLKQDAVLGTAEPIEGNPNILADIEDAKEVENLCTIRRLQFVSPEKLDISSVNTGHIKRIEESAQLPIPEHLLYLYESLLQASKQMISKSSLIY